MNIHENEKCFTLNIHENEKSCMTYSAKYDDAECQ